MEIKKAKIKKAISCSKNDSIVDVAKILRDKKERHVIILDSNKPIGIISTTDISNKVVAMGKNPDNLKALDVMNKKLIVKEINDSLGKAYYDMIRNGFLSCAIVEKGNFKGVLHLRDAIVLLAKEKSKND